MEGFKYGLLFNDRDLLFETKWDVIKGTPEPGATVTVIWKATVGTVYDSGYIFVLPEATTLFMVHIPSLAPKEEDEVGHEEDYAMWISLAALSNDERVEQIIIS